VEVARRWWQRFANAVGALLEEAAARVVLAWAVLRGKSPKPVEKRWWNRATETPVLVDVYDWTDDRLIFSVLVWPSLESDANDAHYIYHQRVEEVLNAIARGGAERMWSTRWELDYGVRWDAKRECWVDGDGHRYDGSRFGSSAGSTGTTHAA
jgi:hypothetical protein